MSCRGGRSKPLLAMLVPLCTVSVLLALVIALPRSADEVKPHSAASVSASQSASLRARASSSPYVDGAGSVTITGTGAAGFSGEGAAASSAELNAPSGLAEDTVGDLFIADTDNCRVREVPAHSGTQFSVQMKAGSIYTVAGGSCGSSGDQLGFVTSVAVDPNGDLFIADPTHDKVFELPSSNGEQLGIEMSAGKLTVVAGTGLPGSIGEGQPAVGAQLNDPQGVALDPAGDLLIADTENCEVREVASHDGRQWGISMVSGHIYRIAGSGNCGQAGEGGSPTSAELWDPTDVAVGPAGDVVISDFGAEEVLDLADRAQDYYGVHIRADHLAVVAGVGSNGPYLIDGLPATGQTAGLNFPADIAVTSSGDLLISDTYSRCIREVPSESQTVLHVAVTTGNMYTLAGALPTGQGGDSTKWVGPEMLYPVGIAVAPNGSVLYSDQGANVVRELAVNG